LRVLLDFKIGACILVSGRGHCILGCDRLLLIYIIIIYLLLYCIVEFTIFM
jgi:hypothetical protein